MIVILDRKDLTLEGQGKQFEEVTYTDMKDSDVPYKKAGLVIYQLNDRFRVLKCVNMTVDDSRSYHWSHLLQIMHAYQQRR
jgi:hypothetical protein